MAKLLELFATVGKPKKIAHDSETVFTNELFKELMNRLSIELHKATVAHHQSYADIERPLDYGPDF